MALLKPNDAHSVADQFEQYLLRPVTLVVATQKDDCTYCAEVQALCEELADLSPQLSVSVHDLEDEAIKHFGLDKAPAIVITSSADGEITDYGIRFYGIPSGYEFMSLLDAINTVGSDQIQLHEDTLSFLADLDTDVHLQVFVTPTCPHCPRAVILAHHLAYASPHVRADMVEAMEFPELSDHYNVYGVPRTIINETVHQEGAAPEPLILQQLRQAVEKVTV